MRPEQFNCTYRVKNTIQIIALNKIIVHLQTRYLDAELSFVDNLTVTYDGNRRKKVGDAVTQRMNYTGASDFVDGMNSGTEYLYDTAGNLSVDFNKGLRYSYDLLGHPRSVKSLSRTDSIEYVYAADGRRLRVRRCRVLTPIMMSAPAVMSAPSVTMYGTTETDEYFGDIILHDGTIDKIRFPGGWYEYNSAGNSYDCQYNIEDYQGNIRLTVHKDATNYGNQMAVVTNDYYPYGNIFRGSSGYKYGGKYLDRTCGLDLYDFHARQYDAQVPGFTSPDPLTEKYYDTSPYMYCAGDPVNKLDPDGKKVWLYATKLPGSPDILSFATHTFIVVTDSDDKVQGYYAYGSEFDGFDGAIGGQLKQQTYDQDINVYMGRDTESLKGKFEITPPDGISQSEFDNTVMEVAGSFGNNPGIRYHFSPTKPNQGNCNTSTSTILLKSGVSKERIEEIESEIPGINTGFNSYSMPWTAEEQKAVVDNERKVRELDKELNRIKLY